jgi:hypothetical protein
MPNYPKPVAQRPANWLANLRTLAATNAAGGTNYTLEHPRREAGDTRPESERGVSVAITGNITFDHKGNHTGIGTPEAPVFGQAVYHEGAWHKVTGGEGGGGGSYTGKAPIAVSGTTIELEALGVTGAYIAEGTITTSKYANVSITGEKIASATIAVAKLKEGELTRPYLKVEGTGAAGKVLGYTASGSGLEWVAGGGGSYTAGEGLELSGTEFKVKAGALTNAMVKAAAGIEESKLSIPEMVTLGGTQEIGGIKSFSAGVEVKGTVTAANLTASTALGEGKVAGKFIFRAPMAYPVYVYSALTGTQNNLKPPTESEVQGGWLELEATGAVTLTGLEYPNVEGQIIFLTNVGTHNVTLATEYRYTGTLHASTEVSGLSSTVGLEVGMTVVGTYVKTGTTITEIKAAEKKIVLSKATTESATETLTFSVGASTAKNRFYLPANIVLVPGQSVAVGYSKTYKAFVEISRGPELWGVAPPTTQHARIAKVEEASALASLLELIERTNEAIKRLNEVTQESLPEYGLTK